MAPRKVPQQSRSATTVEAIVEAAARILEERGPKGLTTNAVADVAGVSIGSLYQYFPNKDAIVRALIEREVGTVAERAKAALSRTDLDGALVALVEVAVAYQLDRPRLALLLESEERRLDAFLDLEAEMGGVKDVLAAALGARFGTRAATPLAADIMALIRVLADTAGRRGENAGRTLASITGAVRGLVAAAASAAWD